jgi:hypothetical protein
MGRCTGWGAASLEKDGANHCVLNELFSPKGNGVRNLPYSNSRNTFQPMLVKAAISWDLLEEGDELLVTSWWQNVGEGPADTLLTGFMDLVFGDQRMPENIPRTHRVEWQPYPALHTWQQGEIWATTCRWKVPKMWGGTYELYLGFRDEQGVPVLLYGKSQYRVCIGEIDIGWGWGRPALEMARKPMAYEFNEMVMINNNNAISLSTEWVIEDGVKAYMHAQYPALTSIQDGDMTFQIPFSKPEVYFRDKKTENTLASYEPEIVINYKTAATGNQSLTYTAEAFYKEKMIAKWTLDFLAKSRQISAVLHVLFEETQFELLEIRLPSIVSLSGSNVNMIDFFGGGRLISTDHALPVGCEHIYDVRNAAAVYNADGAIILESLGLDNKIYQSIQQNHEEKRAVIGVALTARLRAYGELESVPVSEPASFTIDVPDDAWGKPSWQTCAIFLRQGLQGKNRDLYRRALVYKYAQSYGPVPEPWQLEANSSYKVQRLAETHSFDEALDIVKKMYCLTDGGPQVLYLVGWQFEGHDTGYPYVLSVNPKVGTQDDLRRVIEEGHKYNAVITMHDNYDDAYISPYFNKEDIALNQKGNMLKGWAWSAGMSYILSLKRYRQLGFMQERVQKMVELFGIHTSYHLDVMTSEVRRYDFNPLWMSASDIGLQEKKEIINEFNHYGIDITSECLSHPFVGHIGFAYWTRYNAKSCLYLGEEIIPLTSMIYHGTIQYNSAYEGIMDILDSLILGGYAGLGEVQQIEAKHLRGYYLLSMPMGLLYDHQICDYKIDGSKIHIGYGNNSYIQIDKKAKTYEIVLDGRLIGRDWSTFAPGFRPGSYLAFSLHGGELQYPAPEGWLDGSIVRAVTLNEEGEGPEVSCFIQHGMIRMNVPANIPVRIVRQ